MNTTLTSLEENNYEYRIICKGCHKILFYCGHETGVIDYVLCDKCTEVMLDSIPT